MERQIAKGIEVRNKKRIRTNKENENYKYFGILEAGTIIQAEMKEKNKKRVSQTNKKASRKQTLQEIYHQRDKNHS